MLKLKNGSFTQCNNISTINIVFRSARTPRTPQYCLLHYSREEQMPTKRKCPVKEEDLGSVLFQSDLVCLAVDLRKIVIDYLSYPPLQSQDRIVHQAGKLSAFECKRLKTMEDNAQAISFLYYFPRNIPKELNNAIARPAELRQVIRDCTVFPTSICDLVERYAITIVAPQVADDIEHQKKLDDTCIAAIQVLLRTNFPGAHGFQRPEDTILQNLHVEFTRGETIFEVFRDIGNHVAICFAKAGQLYYISSWNNPPSRKLRRRMGQIFCNPDGAPMVVENVPVMLTSDGGPETVCRVASGGAMLLSGMDVLTLSRLVPPPVQQQFKDLRRLLQGRVSPQWSQTRQELLVLRPPVDGPFSWFEIRYDMVIPLPWFDMAIPPCRQDIPPFI